MKLKNHFLSLSALLAMGMGATSAWAEEVKLSGDATNGYYVNMPTPSSTENTIVTNTLSIPDEVKTFKVYNDKGPNESFTASSCNSMKCSAQISLIPPDGYFIHLSGSFSYNQGPAAYLATFSGNETVTTLTNSLLYLKADTTGLKSWTSGPMQIAFYSEKNSSGKGMDLTIDVAMDIGNNGLGAYSFPASVGYLELHASPTTSSATQVNKTTTLTAPEGSLIYVTFNDTLESGDYISVYDGGSSSSPVLLNKSGANNETVHSSSNKLTIGVSSDVGGLDHILRAYVHVVKKNTSLSTTGIDIYKHDNGDFAVAKIIDGEYENSSAVSIPSAINVDVIEYNREFAANTMETIVLPFSLPSGATTNAKFYYLQKVVQPTGVCAWKATLKRVATPEANKPYAIKILDGGTELQIDLGGNKATFQTSETVEQTDATGKWIFKGTYQYKVWNASDTELGLAYALAKENGTNYSAGQFVKIGEGASAAPMRAYMRKVDANVRLSRPLAMGEVSSIENMPETIDVELVDEDEQTTAISRMNTVTGAIKIDRWFDLKGRSTNHKPTTKGAFFNKKGIAK